MITWVSLWWVWLGIALVFAIVELLTPGFIFLGIALGALVLSVVIGLAPDMISGLGFNAMMALFGGLSLIAWIALRFVFRSQTTKTQTFTDDIND
ncbi:MAG: NfeD family protein [Paracoccaceae bacterium]